MKKALGGVLLMLTLTTSTAQGGPLAGKVCYWGVKGAAMSIGATYTCKGIWKWMGYIVARTNCAELGWGPIVVFVSPLGVLACQTASPMLEAAASAAEAAGRACSRLP